MSKAQADFGSFESEFERLGAIVERLEEGSIPLEEMLTMYEEAVALTGKLTKLLTEAELRVEKLARTHEELVGEIDEDLEGPLLEGTILE